MKKEYFLAKSGRTLGPLTRETIEGMRESGEYEKFTWFWDPDQPGWQPTDPTPSLPMAPPPGPGAGPSMLPPPAPETNAVDARSQAILIVRNEAVRSISVVCHNQQSVVSGTLENVTEAGCELIAFSPASSPEFQAKLPVQLHLLDTATGYAMNVIGRVGHVERRDGQWCYKIHWRQCPRIFRGPTEDGIAGRP